MKRIEMVGQTFGKLTVLEHIKKLPESNRRAGAVYHCRCECGNFVQRTRQNIIAAKSPSCGCESAAFITKGKTTHGESYGKYREGTKRYRMLKAASQRARKKGIPIDLQLQDIEVPTHCPVLGIPLHGTSARYDVPSLDRLDNTKGYTKDNVNVISYRANSLKSDATLEELEAIVKWWRATLHKNKSGDFDVESVSLQRMRG